METYNALFVTRLVFLKGTFNVKWVRLVKIEDSSAITITSSKNKSLLEKIMNILQGFRNTMSSWGGTVPPPVRGDREQVMRGYR